MNARRIINRDRNDLMVKFKKHSESDRTTKSCRFPLCIPVSHRSDRSMQLQWRHNQQLPLLNYLSCKEKIKIFQLKNWKPALVTGSTLQFPDCSNPIITEPTNDNHENWPNSHIWEKNNTTEWNMRHFRNKHIVFVTISRCFPLILKTPFLLMTIFVQIKRSFYLRSPEDLLKSKQR